MSRAGFMPQPVTGPNTVMSAVTVAPTSTGPASAGTVFPGSPIAKIMKTRTPVIQISAKNAAGAFISAVVGTIPKAPWKDAVDAAVPRTMPWAASNAAMPFEKTA